MVDIRPMRRSPRTPIGRTIGRAALPALGLGVIAFFGASAVVGRSGVMAYGEYKAQIAERERAFVAVDHRRAVLRNRVALLDPRHANPDMVDELVRRELNVAHPDEVIVPLK